jgi:hypothetical protein
MTQFILKEGAVLPFRNAKNFDPQKIGEAQQELMQRTPNLNQSAQARIWVKEARENRRHVAHQFYDWNVEKAAMNHWVDQTVKMWGVIRLVADDTKRPEPAFISLQARDGQFRSYTNKEVITSLDLQLASVSKMSRELSAMLERFKQFSIVCVHIDAAKASMEAALAASEAIRTQYEQAAAAMNERQEEESRRRRPRRKPEGSRPTA